MKKIMAVAAAALFTFFLLPPQRAAAATDTLPSGISFSSVSEKINEAAADSTEAAFAVSVFSEDGVISEDYFGDIDKENSIRADEDSVFEWGDVSKALIFVSAMQLKEKVYPEGFLQASFIQRADHYEAPHEPPVRLLREHI